MKSKKLAKQIAMNTRQLRWRITKLRWLIFWYETTRKVQRFLNIHDFPRLIRQVDAEENLEQEMEQLTMFMEDTNEQK